MEGKQCDRIGRFFKDFLVTSVLTKVALILGASIVNKKAFVTSFCTAFGKIGLLFILTSGHT